MQIISNADFVRELWRLRRKDYAKNFIQTQKLEGL